MKTFFNDSKTVASAFLAFIHYIANCVQIIKARVFT